MFLPTAAASCTAPCCLVVACNVMLALKAKFPGQYGSACKQVMSD